MVSRVCWFCAKEKPNQLSKKERGQNATKLSLLHRSLAFCILVQATGLWYKTGPCKLLGHEHESNLLLQLQTLIKLAKTRNSPVPMWFSHARDHCSEDDLMPRAKTKHPKTFGLKLCGYNIIADKLCCTLMWARCYRLLNKASVQLALRFRPVPSGRLVATSIQGDTITGYITHVILGLSHDWWLLLQMHRSDLKANTCQLRWWKCKIRLIS